MKILIHAQYYLPKTLAGAEKYLYAVVKHLQGQGHHITILIDEEAEYEYEGVRVTTTRRNILEHYQKADIVFTHLTNSGQAIKYAWNTNKPLIHILHNNHPAAELFYDELENNYIIYNSYALAKELQLPYPSIVVRPGIDTGYWKSDKDHYLNKYITLVNCCREKGGKLLATLADNLPQYQFMGVMGAYNYQVNLPARFRNMQYMPLQEDMRKIYDQTRIIIIPSYYESWSLVAAEAMASGIPVICTNTPGLQENCGGAAIYAEARLQPYKATFETLEDRDVYSAMVQRGLTRNHFNDLHRITEFMKDQIKTEHDIREKEEMKGIREKRIILKPGKKRKKRKYVRNEVIQPAPDLKPETNE